MKNILIIGTGSIALQHYRNLTKIKKKKNLNLNFFIHSKNINRGKNIEKKYHRNIKFLNKKDFNNYNFTNIVIATSISEHFKWIKYFAFKKNLIFCEKPLVCEKNQIQWLKRNKKKIKNKIFVGFQSRFHPIIEKINKQIKNKNNGKLYSIDFKCGQNIKYWRPNTDYKKEFAYGKMNHYKKSVVWELCHDLDLALFFLGKPSSISGFEKKLSNLKIKAKDYAKILLNYNNKLIANISLNMFSPVLYRNINIIFSKKIIEIDLVKNLLTEFKNKKVNIKKFNWKRNSSLYTEMENFISNKFKKFSKIEDGINVSELLINFQKNGNKKTF